MARSKKNERLTLGEVNTLRGAIEAMEKELFGLARSVGSIEKKVHYLDIGPNHLRAAELLIDHTRKTLHDRRTSLELRATIMDAKQAAETHRASRAREKRLAQGKVK